MKVYLSFDIEVWFDGWADLDSKFEAFFRRYVYGRSAHGDYALPKTLEILNRHDLRGVFFVEPMFSGRFGPGPLAEISGLIQAAGQDVQLHLHPEWTDEMRPPLFVGPHSKRQHLHHYDAAEQTALIAWALQRMGEVGVGAINTFRAGSYAANWDTLHALAQNGIRWDSSFNPTTNISGGDLREDFSLENPFELEGVRCIPISVFRDGLGQLRHAQVGACSFAELRNAIEQAHALGREHFVIVSHNFEMLKPDSSQRDVIVVRRFERLCAWLAQNRDRFQVGSFAGEGLDVAERALPEVGLFDTAWRYGEQAARRLMRGLPRHDQN